VVKTGTWYHLRCVNKNIKKRLRMSCFAQSSAFQPQRLADDLSELRA
jgi:hypothetical protein